MKDQKTIPVNKKLLDKMQQIIDINLEYEALSDGNRGFEITSEIGEVKACELRKLKLLADPNHAGYDALDGSKKVQIKARRSRVDELPKSAGRLSKFSEHPFDYALLVLLTKSYMVAEIWKATYKKLKPVIDKPKGRNPAISAFKKVAHKVYPKP